MAGESYDDFWARHGFVNIYRSALARWSRRDAARRALSILFGSHADVVVLLGRRVQEAFGYLASGARCETSLNGRRIILLPHPSGRNRWYNSETNKHIASEFIRYVDWYVTR